MKFISSRATAAVLAAFLVAALPATNAAHAIEIDGFRFDDRLRLGDSELVANGAGIRTKFGRRYAMALYLPARSSDARAVLTTKGPKRIAINLIKDVSGDTFADAVAKGIGNNSSDAEKTALQERLKQLVDAVVAVGEIKAGASIVFDWHPDRGTVLAINGQPQGKTIAGEDFYTALLKVWLGEDPVQNDLKRSLLGSAN